jgi:hypothetical protein
MFKIIGSWLQTVVLGVSFGQPGEWVTTESGVRVCRLVMPLQAMTPMTLSFCDDWQPGFPKPVNGQRIPFEQGWVRQGPGGGIQLHTEKGWGP